MGRNVAGAGLTLTMLIMAASQVMAKVSVVSPTTAQAKGSALWVRQVSKPAFVPEDFNVPIMVKTENFKILPLGPDLVNVDYKAYMSSIEHLQKTFTRSPDWPHKDISDADEMQDMEAEQARFRSRESFAYAVLTPDGSRERGCVYVSPSTVEGYDAIVRIWVTKAEYDAGFDTELYAWVANWMRKDWPFAKIAYPGRAIEWGAWDSIVAINKAREAKAEIHKD